MPLTVYSDIKLPNSIISAGVRGKNMRMNERAQNQAGYDSINVLWQRTLRQFELGTVPLTIDQWQDLEGIFEATDGGAFGFLMTDPKDSKADTLEGKLQPFIATGNVGAIGAGYGVPTYQLCKRYTAPSSSRTKDRKITRPQIASLLRAGSPVVEGAGVGNVAIDNNTGIATFVADTNQIMTGIVTGASTTLNFTNGIGIVAALSVGQRVYVTGVTGTAAALLNGMSHVISAKGATSLTISTSTIGTTGAAGTSWKYPQASEALAWSGAFYVPVHFAEDEIEWDLTRAGDFDSRLLTGPSLQLIEIRE